MCSTFKLFEYTNLAGLQAIQAVLPAAAIRDLLVRDCCRAEQRGPLRFHGSSDDVEALQVSEGDGDEPATEHEQGHRQPWDYCQGRYGELRAHGWWSRPPEGKQRERVQPASQHLEASKRASWACSVCSSLMAFRALPTSVSIWMPYLLILLSLKFFLNKWCFN